MVFKNTGLIAKNGTMRFNELMRNVPNISQKMLTTALKKLEADMLVIVNYTPKYLLK